MLTGKTLESLGLLTIAMAILWLIGSVIPFWVNNQTATVVFIAISQAWIAASIVLRALAIVNKTL